MIQELNERWVVVDRENKPKVYSIALSEGMSANLYSMETGEAWQVAAQNGFRCVKVNISFTEVK